MKNKCFTLIFVLFAPALVSAETFTNDEFGYTIDIDDSYQLGRNDDATYFRSKQNDSVIIIRNWPGLDEDTAKNYLTQGYQDARMAMVPAGELEETAVDDGKGFLVDIKGIVERRPIKGIAGGFVGNKGQGMVVVFSGPEEGWDKLAPLVKQSAASIKFIDFKPGPDARDWYYILSGSRLSFRGKVDDDRRVREDLNLCRDGRFLHRISSSAIQDSALGSSFGHSAKSRSGVWEVIVEDGTSKLHLHYNDGRNESAVIEDRSRRIFIDDRPYSRLRKNSCR